MQKMEEIAYGIRRCLDCARMALVDALSSTQRADPNRTESKRQSAGSIRKQYWCLYRMAHADALSKRERCTTTL